MKESCAGKLTIIAYYKANWIIADHLTFGLAFLSSS